MKTPTWATTIGILMIVFGGCSVMNDIQAIRLPEEIEKAKVRMEKEMDKAKEEALENAVDSLEVSTDSLAASREAKKIEEGQKIAEDVLNIPEFSKTWIVRFGYVGLATAVIYVLGGIFLLVKRKFSINLCYAALIISILTSGTQAAVLTSGSSSGLIALSTGLGQIVGIIIDIIFIAVIFSSDKEAYNIP